MVRFRSVIMAIALMTGAQQAQAFTISIKGTIDTSGATVSGPAGSFPAIFSSNAFSGAIGTNAAGQFYSTLLLPSFTSNGPGCNLPNSGCAVLNSGGSFTVADTGDGFSMSSVSKVGDVVTFSVVDGPSGSISGTFDLGVPNGSINADVSVGSAFRGDNPSSLDVTLAVTAVPLPGSAPLLGMALVVLGVLGAAYRRAKHRQRTVATI